jgi:DNA-binding IclR family transcriptional regulator
MKEDRHFVTALARGLDVLRCFTAENRELGSTEIARLLGLSQSTVWRLCYTLQKAGYLMPGHDPERLRVSPGVLALGCEALSHGGIAEAALPRITEIANRFESSVSLAGRDQLDMRILARASAPTMLRLNFHIGSALQIERSAVGAAYLAALPDAERNALLNDLRQARPQEWETHHAYLEEAIAAYRTHGYVLNLRRYHPDVNAVGVAVVSPNGRHVMAMNCGGASSIMTREKLEGPVAQAMIELAAELSTMLTV